MAAAGNIWGKKKRRSSSATLIRLLMHAFIPFNYIAFSLPHGVKLIEKCFTSSRYQIVRCRGQSEKVSNSPVATWTPERKVVFSSRSCAIYKTVSSQIVGPRLASAAKNGTFQCHGHGISFVPRHSVLTWSKISCRLHVNSSRSWRPGNSIRHESS